MHHTSKSADSSVSRCGASSRLDSFIGIGAEKPLMAEAISPDESQFGLPSSEPVSTHPSDEKPADGPKTPRQRLERIADSRGNQLLVALWWRLHNSHDAEDALQDGLLAALQRFTSDEAVRNDGGFVYCVCQRKAVDVGRRRWRYAPLDGADVADPRCDEPERRERDEGLARAVGGLPENWRAAIILRYWEGMSVREVAAELDQPYSTVRGWLARADQELRVALRDWRDDEEFPPEKPREKSKKAPKRPSRTTDY